MPEISIDVAGRNHRLMCGPGEEKHLQELANLIDREARELAKTSGAQMAEGRLMLMSALMVADRLHDTLARCEELEAQLAAAGNGAADPAREAEIAERISVLAGRAEALAPADA